jgi:hypothetical protein
MEIKVFRISGPCGNQGPEINRMDEQAAIVSNLNNPGKEFEGMNCEN